MVLTRQRLKRRTRRLRKKYLLPTWKFPTRQAARSLVHRKGRRRRKTGERTLPVSLCTIRILLLKPADVVAVRPKRRQVEPSSLAERLVSQTQFAEYLRHRPAVQQQVMQRPDE